jgi:non-lysosomal glucosylceramidase
MLIKSTIAFLVAGGFAIVALAQAPQTEPAPRALSPDHWVPVEKRLPADWTARLYERGAPHVCRGGELNFIGMPVGGIGAGQMYITGDGQLACWQIFNQQYFSSTGAKNYQPHMPARPVAQGVALVLDTANGPVVRTLNRRDFPGVEFVGQYPIAQVHYAADDLPVSVDLAAFSPFIPLSARDSALPATILEYTIENKGTEPARLALLAWLENAVCFHLRRDQNVRVNLVSSLLREPNRTFLVHTAEERLPADCQREDILLADFEGPDYGEWTATGEAFGGRPAGGTLPDQQPVGGFVGEGLVNTFLGGDGARGTLTSPEFELNRGWLCFLIGGGAHAGQTCVNLLVDGKVERTATGHNNEGLTWQMWDVSGLQGRRAVLQIVDDSGGGWGHINVDQVLLSDRPRYGPTGTLADLPDYGQIVLAADAPAAGADQVRRWLSRARLDPAICAAQDGKHVINEHAAPAFAAQVISLAPGARHTLRVVVAWYFHNRAEGNVYTNWAADAGEIARYVLDHYARLAGDTRRWHDTYYGSTLPQWLLERVHSTAGTLATGTCNWWKCGRFWCWEGVGCCGGTCTHVYNYAQTIAYLFPELERRVRERQDLGAALHDDGLVGFRGRQNKAYAADGQAGTVLKCYREHLMSADDGFLRRNWPNIRSVLEYLMSHDADGDGIITDAQPNTYDIDFEGPNTFVGALYLAALRAGEQMASLTGDMGLANETRRRFEAGRRWTVDNLWNGEYFIQRADLQKYPKYQYADGCLADQLFGQTWASQLGLGDLYPPEYARAALRSIWNYNWAPDVGPHSAAHRPERWFAMPGEAGLFLCTWPHSPHPGAAGVRYRDEVWTGIEYQVAADMIQAGLLDDGLSVVRAIHERYDPARRNPFNEVECGDHYARALASWGVFLALCGFEVDGPQGHLGFKPLLHPEDFRAAFTAPEGWGSFEQEDEAGRRRCRVAAAWGRIRLRSLALAAPAGKDNVTVQLGNAAVSAEVTHDGERVLIRFAKDVVLVRDDVLEISIKQ